MKCYASRAPLLEGIADAHDAGVLHLDTSRESSSLQTRQRIRLRDPKNRRLGLAQTGLGSAAPNTPLSAPRSSEPSTTCHQRRSCAEPSLRVRICTPRAWCFFELLGVGLLHSGDTRDERLRARCAKDPCSWVECRTPRVRAHALARSRRGRFVLATGARSVRHDRRSGHRAVNSRGPMSEPPRKGVPRPAMSAVAGDAFIRGSVRRAENVCAGVSGRSPDMKIWPPPSVRPMVAFSAPTSTAALTQGEEKPSSIPEQGHASSSPVAAPAPPPRVYELDDVPEKAVSESLAAMDMANAGCAVPSRAQGTFVVWCARSSSRFALIWIRRAAFGAAYRSQPIARMVGSAFLALRAKRVTRARVGLGGGRTTGAWCWPRIWARARRRRRGDGHEGGCGARARTRGAQRWAARG